MIRWRQSSLYIDLEAMYAAYGGMNWLTGEKKDRNEAPCEIIFGGRELSQ